MNLPSIRDVLGVLLCSIALALLALVVGYLVEERLIVAIVSSLGMVVVLYHVTIKRYGGTSIVFTQMVFVIVLGTFIYLTMYYLVAGLFLGYKVDLTSLEFLLVFLKSGIFFVQYLIYVILFLLTSLPLVVAAIVIDEVISTRPQRK